MEKEYKYSEEYPQCLYDHLANPEFRELLVLEYRDVEGNYSKFTEQLVEIGRKLGDYSEILFQVAIKEFDLQQKH